MAKWKLPVITVSILLVALGLSRKWLTPASTDLLQTATPPQILEHIRQLNSPVVLVNFWATWCEPCKEEFPSILTLRERYKTQGLQVVFVSLDTAADRAATESFLRQNGVTFTTFFRGDQPLKFVNEIYPAWAGAIPMSLLIGADLKVLEAWEGDTSLEEFETRVKRHLKGT